MRHCTQCGAAAPADARFCPRCGAAVAAVGGSDAMLGKVIADRYLLVEKIGQGGSGTIYRGEHTTLRKRVAVKVLHAQLSTDDTALERFRREATTVAELDNDHILQVLDFGRTEDKRLFFAMEYLEGEPLTKVLERDKQLPILRAVDIVTQIAEALVEAHGLGYVHRDLRPRNVFLINRRGRADFVKLLDFGLSKLILPDAEAKQTAMGMTFGDPRYMSPEQARGEALDRRSDIYSLGAIAFEMLTGTPPYTGSGTFEILQQHLDAPVPRVRDRRPDCPEWLDQVVQRALAKRPDGRFVTVLKLVESLRAQQPPGQADAAEKAEHAKLSAARPPAASPAPAAAPVATAHSSAPAVATPVVPSMGPPTKAQPAAVDQLPPGPAHQTMMMHSLKAPAPAAPSGKKKDKKDKGDSKKSTTPPVASAAAGSVQVTPAPTMKAPEAVNVPSVVVESSSQDKTVPERVPPDPVPPPPALQPAERPTLQPAERATLQPAERPTVASGLPAPSVAVPPPPATPAPGTEARKKDPTGEWFSSDSQPMRTIPGATDYDDFDDVPRTNRGPIIIAAVAGGLTLMGIVVIALLPKPAHKPLRGEETAQTQASGATASPTGASASPTGASAQPTGAAASPTGAAVAAAPSGAPTQPTGASVSPTGASAQPTGASAQPSVATPSPGQPGAQPAAIAATSKPAPAVAPAEKPAPKAAVVESRPATKEPPAKAEKPATRLAAAEKPAAHEPPAEKPAPVEKRHKAPEGFKDPFAADAPKAAAASSSESAQAEFFVKLGRQKLSSSDLTAAAANFNKAREYDARSSEAIAGLGEVAFEQGDYSGAAVHLKQALRLSPNRPRYLVLLGDTYYKLGRPKDAVDEYKKALRLDPSNREAQHSLESAQRKLGSGG